jgi:hypothetical protein
MEIELTSARPDGTWTWRAAGAREPKGVLDGAILPAGSKAGDVLRVEAEIEIDGISVLSVVPTREKAEKANLLELKPVERPFEPVTQQLATKGRGDRRREGDRRPRRDGERGDRRPRRDDERGEQGERRERAERRDRGEQRAPQRGERRERRERPSFTPPPELPPRPKPKRLKPGRAHRSEVLAQLPEEQRPIAELALQGMQAVRQRLREDNARLKAEGKPEMPETSVLKMAEELLPKLRVAEWLDRAEAAKRDLDQLDLRDLRSVVAASDDPMVARDESTRELAAELRRGLTDKQEREYANWLDDIEAALGVGRVVRALKLSGQPPKAGALFPAELAQRLVDATSASLTADAPAERWITVLEAAAFSPVHARVTVTSPPPTLTDELTATVKRLGPLLTQVATALGIDVPPGAPLPKPLRPQRPAPKKPARPSPGPRPAAPTATTEPEPPADITPEPKPPADTTPEPQPPADTTPEPEPPADTTPEPEPSAHTTPTSEAESSPEDASSDEPG